MSLGAPFHATLSKLMPQAFFRMAMPVPGMPIAMPGSPMPGIPAIPTIPGMPFLKVLGIGSGIWDLRKDILKIICKEHPIISLNSYVSLQSIPASPL